MEVPSEDVEFVVNSVDFDGEAIMNCPGFSAGKIPTADDDEFRSGSDVTSVSSEDSRLEDSVSSEDSDLEGLLDDDIDTAIPSVSSQFFHQETDSSFDEERSVISLISYEDLVSNLVKPIADKQVFIKLDKSTITLNVDLRNDSVLDVKYRIFDKFVNFFPKFMRLMYEGKDMKNQRKLLEYNIQEHNTLHLIMGLDGGELGCAVSSIMNWPRFKFINVLSNNYELIRFTNSAPRWRYVSRGLTMEGFCRNANCVASGKEVLCMHGYCGVYMIGVEESTCPVCFKTIELIRPYFWDCEVVFRGNGDDGIGFKVSQFFTAATSYNIAASGKTYFRRFVMEIKKMR